MSDKLAMTEAELRAVIQAVCNERRGPPQPAATWLATEIMARLDFPRELHAVGYAACHAAIQRLVAEYLGLAATDVAVAVKTPDDPERLRCQAEALELHADALEIYLRAVDSAG